MITISRCEHDGALEQFPDDGQHGAGDGNDGAAFANPAG
jgi:hypothetical protein